MKITNEELKPCPFCGKPVDMYKYDYNEYNEQGIQGHEVGFVIICFDCHIDMGEYNTEEEAIKAWNRRAEWDQRIIP